ncbi:MAG: hypothetical protein HDQ98_11795 [Lachnospiraceae bacterium]|nr:hypothetical protein [Lachnospiraceae bacterium]
MEQELKLKYESFRQNKGVYQHYYLDAVWEESPEFEYEGSRYRLETQTAVDNGGVTRNTIQLDLYPAAREYCGGRSVNGRFLSALEEAANALAGKEVTLVAEVVEGGKAAPAGTMEVNGQCIPKYILGEMTLTMPLPWLKIRFRFREPITVFYDGTTVQLEYVETITFIVQAVE